MQHMSSASAPGTHSQTQSGHPSFDLYAQASVANSGPRAGEAGGAVRARPAGAGHTGYRESHWNPRIVTIVIIARVMSRTVAIQGTQSSTTSDTYECITSQPSREYREHLQRFVGAQLFDHLQTGPGGAMQGHTGGFCWLCMVHL